MDQIFVYKYQVASIGVLLILIYNYFKNKRLPLLSTKCFTVFLFVSFFNLFADMVSVYAINHYWTMSDFTLRFCHQIFVGSLDVLAFSLYLYVEILDNSQKRFNPKELLLRLLPLIFAAVMVIFAPIQYHVSYGVYYSYGAMPSTVYISAAVYVSLILFRINRKACTLSKGTRNSITLGLCIWTGICLYQLFHPTALMSSVGCMLMVLFVYLSFENPKEYLDVETGTLNRRAFHLVTEEMTEGKKNFIIVTIILKDVDYLQNLLGHTGVYDVLDCMHKYMDEMCWERIYHSRSDSLSLMFTNKEKANLFVGCMKKLQFEYKAKDIQIFPRYDICVLELPKYAQKCDEVYKLLDYVRTQYDTEGLESNIVYIDDNMINELNYYEAVEKIVENAIDNDGLDIFFQPIYDVESDRFASAEVLVRLKDTTTLGYISPEIFIPIAEQRGMIKKLGNIVFEKMCIFIKENELVKKGIHYLEVNLSGIQGTDRNIVKQLKDYMEQYDIPPSFVNLEITETAAIEAGEKLKQNMDKLIDLGCKFSLDDFGTGYSNLAKIADGGYCLIKLDKSLLWPCFEDDAQDAVIILNNCINMILQLGMKIVSEGVETKEQVDFLSQKGVNYLQGYYFSKPINGEDYLAFLKKHSRLDGNKE